MLRLVVEVKNACKLEPTTSSSSFRFIDWHQGNLTMKEAKIYETPNKCSDITEICYIQSSVRQRSTYGENCDYLFVCSNDGFIQVFSDVQDALFRNRALRPLGFLTCNVEIARCDIKLPIISLDYLDGMLYCLCANGQLCVFILDLPNTYVKSRSPVFTQRAKEANGTDLNLEFHRLKLEGLSSEDLKLLKQSPYTGSIHNPYNYLAPAHETFRTRKKHIYGMSQSTAPCFQPSFTLNLGPDVSLVRINPYNKYSFFTNAVSGRLTLQKIRITPNYLLYFKRLKSFIKQASKEMIRNCWTLCITTDETGISTNSPRTVLNGYYPAADPLAAIEKEQLELCADHSSRRETCSSKLRMNSGVPELQYYSCWREAILNKIESSCVDSAKSSLRGLKVKPSVARKKRKSPLKVQDAAKDAHDINCGDDSTESIMGRATFDFGFIEKSSGAIDHRTEAISLANELEGERATRESFLPNFYRNLKILSMGGDLKLKVLYPSVTSRPYLISDSNNATESWITALRRIPRDRWFSQWLFLINENYHLAISAEGVMLFNSSRITEKLPNSSLSNRKNVDFSLGLVLDAVVLVKNVQICHGCSDCQGDIALSLDIVVTCVDKLIMVLEVNFPLHSKVGNWQILDVARLPEPTKELGRLTVMEFPEIRNQKRKYKSLSKTSTSTKRVKTSEEQRTVSTTLRIHSTS
ncbi:Gid12p LALA0_S05e04434g [Lachancea lanzarotensis]|uniref:LALA0S05e04434g1_1 n=1 Tax=Lachancea lanzarotensis TaxID=1245769 RepID=A0A0C7MXF1_9SACH|nr:uncharacterized protein LALA0_S05e04434g [Lachancea lanzarotensis]CEP62384.1 LALA0S05e04434g1_1 [Lachancea lanzarotensis]